MNQITHQTVKSWFRPALYHGQLPRHQLWLPTRRRGLFAPWSLQALQARGILGDLIINPRACIYRTADDDFDSVPRFQPRSAPPRPSTRRPRLSIRTTPWRWLRSSLRRAPHPGALRTARFARTPPCTEERPPSQRRSHPPSPQVLLARVLFWTLSLILFNESSHGRVCSSFVLRWRTDCLICLVISAQFPSKVISYLGTWLWRLELRLLWNAVICSVGTALYFLGKVYALVLV